MVLNNLKSTESYHLTVLLWPPNEPAVGPYKASVTPYYVLTKRTREFASFAPLYSLDHSIGSKVQAASHMLASCPLVQFS